MTVLVHYSRGRGTGARFRSAHSYVIVLVATNVDDHVWCHDCSYTTCFDFYRASPFRFLQQIHCPGGPCLVSTHERTAWPTLLERVMAAFLERTLAFHTQCSGFLLPKTTYTLLHYNLLVHLQLINCRSCYCGTFCATLARHSDEIGSHTVGVHESFLYYRVSAYVVVIGASSDSLCARFVFLRVLCATSLLFVLLYFLFVCRSSPPPLIILFCLPLPRRPRLIILL